MSESFQQNVDALFRGMEQFMTSKTVVGQPVHVGNATILPLVDVSFGMMASTKNEKDRRNGGGGMGGKMSPSALLIIKDGATRLVNVRSQDSLTKIIDMAPELIERFSSRNKTKTTPQEDAVMQEAAKEEKTF